MESIPPLSSRQAIERILAALGDQLEASGVNYELVVIGGSALLALGVISRATRDVDLVAISDGLELRSAEPLPEPLERARDLVARDLGLPTSWLNAGPTDLLRLGLPEGFLDRVQRQEFGPGLSVLFASRLDQVYLKLYALVDQGPGKHELDLRALSPTSEELIAAACWSRTHDPSDGYRTILQQALGYLGVDDADLGD